MSTPPPGTTIPHGWTVVPLLLAGLVPLSAAGLGGQPPKKKLGPDPVVMSTRHSFQAHKEGVATLTFSPDGKALATTGSPDRGVKLWNAKTGKELASFETHKERMSEVVFAPDGKTFATTGQDRNPGFWDMLSGDEKRIHKAAGYSVRVWAVPSGDKKEIGKTAEYPLTVEKYGSLAFRSNGTLLIARLLERGVAVSELTDDKELFRWTGAPDKAMLYDFNSTRDVVHVCVGAVGGRSGFHLITWQPAPGRQDVHEITPIEDHMYSNPWSVVVSPDGKYVAAGYGADLKDFLSEENRKRQEAWGWRLLATRLLMKKSEEGHVRVWDVAAGKERFMTLGHFAQVEQLVFSPDGRYLASRDDLNMVKVWDVARGKPLNRLHGRITTMVFTPDGKNLVTGDEKGWVQFWEFVE